MIRGWSASIMIGFLKTSTLTWLARHTAGLDCVEREAKNRRPRIWEVFWLVRLSRNTAIPAKARGSIWGVLQN